jgi:hypothetical protein
VIAEKMDDDKDSKDKDKDKDKATGQTDKKAKKGDKKKEEPKKELKTGADSGKIVNLMAGESRSKSIVAKNVSSLVGDTNRIANVVGAAYYIYSAPFEIVVASVFLYE